MIPNEVLSPELHVKPLGDDEVAVYKLCSADEIDFSRQDEETGKFRNKAAGYTLAEKYSVYDPIKKRKVLIGNVTSIKHENLPNKEVREVPVLTHVRFELGKTITITSRQQDTYQFMERVDSNRDNPFRNPAKKAWFYRVNEKKAANDKNYKSMILLDALNWIKDINSTELKTINKGLASDMKMNLDLDWEILKARLFDITMADPVMVMKCSTNQDAKYKIQVMDAAKYQIITFDEGEGKRPRAWYLNRDDNPLILKLEVGQNKIEALVAHFKTKDGGSMYSSMIAKLKAFLKSGAPDVN